METGGPDVKFINIEYFFRLIYNALFGARTGEVTVSGGGGGFNFDGVLATLSHIWLFYSVLAYLFSLAAVGVLVYATMRIFQVRAEEKEKYKTISKEVMHEKVEKTRWAYIQELIESGQESDWRQAIIECDIIMDQMLSRLQYAGDTLGEKLRGADPSRFRTLSSAWDAHKVRNEIAHQGSSYQLSESLAHRTIANYEAVFREFDEI